MAPLLAPQNLALAWPVGQTQAVAIPAAIAS